MKPHRSPAGMGMVLAVCAAIGAISVAATLAFGRVSLVSRVAAPSSAEATAGASVRASSIDPMVQTAFIALGAKARFAPARKSRARRSHRR